MLHTRRGMLSRSAHVAAMRAGWGLLRPAAHAAWSKDAFEAKSLTDAVKDLCGSAPTLGKDVIITGPDIAEGDAVVRVGAASSLPGVKCLALMVEKDANTQTAVFDVCDAVESSLFTRPKKVLGVEVEMAGPMRTRIHHADDKVRVRVLMSHGMETGQRKGSAGKTSPAGVMQEVRVAHNGKPGPSAQCGPAVSKNPYMQFTVKGAKTGDRIAVSWVDNKGDKCTGEASVG